MPLHFRQSRDITSTPADQPGEDHPNAAPGHVDLDTISHTRIARVLTPDEIEGLCSSPAATSNLSIDQTLNKLTKIKAYVHDILNDTKCQVEPEFAALTKQVMDWAASLRQLYAYVLPRKGGLKKADRKFDQALHLEGIKKQRYIST